MKAGSVRILGIFVLAAGTLMGMSSIGYGQPYEPEHIWHRCGEENEDYFGYYMAGIGDVNGDTCDDFIIYERYPVTRAVLFYGGNPPDTIPDLLIHNPYPYGYFGRHIENIGDANHDGSDDIAINGGYEQEDIQRVFIYLGGGDFDTIPDVVLSEATFWDGFGSKIEGIGDVNGDGYDDVAVHASNYPFPQGNGKVWIYFGGSPMDSDADWSQEGSGQHVAYGNSISGKGSLNGDGYDDFAIYENTGYPSPDDTRYYIYYGGDQLDTIPDVIIHGTEYYPEIDLSSSSALIQNLNGDSFADLVIDAAMTSNAIVLWGGNPMNTTIDVILRGFDPNPLERNMNLAFAGDVNRDGYGDIIASQPAAYGGNGIILAYLGCPWMDGYPDMFWDCWQTQWAACGTTLTNIGDMNGDGVDDIVFGSLSEAVRGSVDIWAGDSLFVVNVPEDQSPAIPQSFRLLPPYPNPFNSSITIPFEITPGLAGDLSLRIFNVLGQEVLDLSLAARNLVSSGTATHHEVVWNGRDFTGADCGSGIYLVELRTGTQKQTEKIVLLK